VKQSLISRLNLFIKMCIAYSFYRHHLQVQVQPTKVIRTLATSKSIRFPPGFLKLHWNNGIISF